MTDDDMQRPEGALLARLREANRISGRQAAARAGISEGRWRQIEKGFQSAGGQRVPVRAPASTLASMGNALGASRQQMVEVGREDAADLMPEAPDGMVLAEHLQSEREQARRVLLADASLDAIVHELSNRVREAGLNFRAEMSNEYAISSMAERQEKTHAQAAPIDDAGGTPADELAERRDLTPEEERESIQQALDDEAARHGKTDRPGTDQSTD